MGRWDRETRDRESSYKKRSRSRSPYSRRSKRRSRSRSRSRERRKDRKERRQRSRSKSRERSPKVEDVISVSDFDDQQKKLEIIMQKRRERVEKWRAEHNKNNSEEVPADPAIEATNEKKWTLSDDDEDEEENALEPTEESPENAEDGTPEGEGEVNEPDSEVCEKQEEPIVEPEPKPVEEPEMEQEVEEADEIDPLDEYMQTIQEEVKKQRKINIKEENKYNEKAKKNISLVVGLAKNSTQMSKRGELVEQNQDGLEYSSEDDNPSGLAEDLMSSMNKPQKKLMTISAADLNYEEFRKNFYIEVPELTKMSDEEVAKIRFEMERIKVKGKGCPKPILSWPHAGVSKKILDILKKHNYTKPTPIQAQAIPCIMSGRDVIGIAKTGSGKTLGYLIPMFRHILDQQELEPGDGPIAIIMTPTRELATQIWAECRKFSKSLGLRVVAVYGGTPISEQIGELKPGAEIVVCTPGRMIDMLAANSGRVTNLRRLTYLVVDEADRMFDMGFEPQLMRIIDSIRPDRQTIMFSATFPRVMEALARRILVKPVEIQVGLRSEVCKDIRQNVIILDNDDDKFLKLLQILGEKLSNRDKSCIIFVDKQDKADSLLKELMHASYTCLALHGGIDQMDRDSIISDFKHLKYNVLIATSVAARGLDVKHCALVVNYSCPNHYEDYVHRVGRTGRAGNHGEAFTFLTRDEGKYAVDIIKAFEVVGQQVPEDLTILFNLYKAQQEAEGKTMKKSSGFKGKGFKFDEAEAQLANEKKKFQKAALGLQDSDDEDENTEEISADIDHEIESMLAPKRSTVSNITFNSDINFAGATTISEKLELARKLASKITGNMTVNKPTNWNTEAFLKGDLSVNISSALTAKSIAEQRAEKLHLKLNYVPKDDDDENGGSMIEGDPNMMNPMKRYEEELEINDFPQQARWRVTSKEALAQISEYSEAGITVRGTYFPPGKDPKDLSERKLYLAIEGTTDLSVAKAKSEIIRLIKEELIKLQNAYPPSIRGRYKVL